MKSVHSAPLLMSFFTEDKFYQQDQSNFHLTFIIVNLHIKHNYFDNQSIVGMNIA